MLIISTIYDATTAQQTILYIHREESVVLVAASSLDYVVRNVVNSMITNYLYINDQRYGAVKRGQ